MAMVSVGSCIFSEVGLALAGPHVDATRIAAQVVTGIGFLGAGAIIRQRGDIRGLTTAAGVWVAAAIGMATGFRLYILATLGTAMVVVALAGLRPIARLLPRHEDEEEEEEDPAGPGAPPPFVES